MIKICFSCEDIFKIRELSKNHPHPFVRQKSLVLLMKSSGVAHHLISKIAGVSENTVRNYLHSYIDRKMESLTEIPFSKQQSKLVSFESVIRNYLNESPPSTIKQACSEIFKLTNIEIKETQMRKFLKSLGVKFRKVATIPGKVNVEQQVDFHDNYLQPRLESAQAGEREVYFIDAAHFVLGAFLGYLWCFKRIFVRTPSGRQRFNVLGALNAISKKLITITNDSYITSIQVCELLTKIAEQATLPVTIILDNAKYQRCKLVQDLAEKLKIELLFLPPYSPNLNLIERMWKFVKKNSLNSRYYDNFNKFRESISSLIETAHVTYSDELKSLLSLKFQIFTEEQIKKAA